MIEGIVPPKTSPNQLFMHESQVPRVGSSRSEMAHGSFNPWEALKGRVPTFARFRCALLGLGPALGLAL